MKLQKINYQTFIYLFLILIIGTVLRLVISTSIPIRPSFSGTFLIADLISKPVYFSWWVIFLFEIFNIILLFIIGSKILSNKFGLILSLIYSISLWTAYTQVFGSIFIIFLSGLLIFSLGIVLFRTNKTLALTLTISSTCFLLYSYLFSWFFLPVIFAGLYYSGFVSKKILQTICIWVLIIFLPLIFFSLRNPVGIINIFHRQFDLFDNVGILNDVNVFQGETTRAGYHLAGKVIENKYIYFFRYLLFNILKHFAPSTYFTSQEKLFGFSFTTPIFVGFLIPLIFGIRKIFLSQRSNKIISFTSLSLMVPSIMSKTSPDLVRLVIFSPVVFFLVALGINEISSRRLRFVMTIIILLVVFQVLVTISDIYIREPIRYQEFIGGK